MTENLKGVIGSALGRSQYSPDPSVIGEVRKSQAGNTVLRVGRLLKDGGWTQTEHVALTPQEREELIRALESHRKHRAIKIGDTVAALYTVVSVQYLNATADDGLPLGVILARSETMREWAVFTADAYGDVRHGTYCPDRQKAMDVYLMRIMHHTYLHLDATPPDIEFASIGRRIRGSA